ncbi:hypothetical protein CHS0354_039993 [Potamilus streckersoni]|uniref:Receptor ligand binding region domain-containing protein n=1 Tax=Potamilus streckersoni TaxID=2493646 RepID=A0AAE0S004_9BIVA|nr:hypothetical protein CHS0354_039993 [Potamilus streckersoni]
MKSLIDNLLYAIFLIADTNAIDEMGKTFEQNNITTKASKSFRHVDQVHGKLKELKALDVRIIFGGFSEPVARYVMCEAYKLGMYSSRYVWIMLSEYVERWWELSNNTTCTRSALSQAVEGYFIIDSLNALTDEDRSSANISLRDFLLDYEKYNGTKPMSPYATSTYDTVWTIALTLRKALQWTKSGVNSTNKFSLESFNYDNGEKIRKVFFNIMQELEFLGISGPISFQGPDREGIAVINQNQGDAMRRIALYEPDNGKLNFYCPSCQPILWKG